MREYRLYTHNIVPSGGRVCHNLARYRRKLSEEGVSCVVVSVSRWKLFEGIDW